MYNIDSDPVPKPPESQHTNEQSTYLLSTENGLEVFNSDTAGDTNAACQSVTSHRRPILYTRFYRGHLIIVVFAVGPLSAKII